MSTSVDDIYQFYKLEAYEQVAELQKDFDCDQNQLFYEKIKKNGNNNKDIFIMIAMNNYYVATRLLLEFDNIDLFRFFNEIYNNIKKSNSKINMVNLSNFKKFFKQVADSTYETKFDKFIMNKLKN